MSRPDIGSYRVLYLVIRQISGPTISTQVMLGRNGMIVASSLTHPLNRPSDRFAFGRPLDSRGRPRMSNRNRATNLMNGRGSLYHHRLAGTGCRSARQHRLDA